LGTQWHGRSHDYSTIGILCGIDNDSGNGTIYWILYPFHQCRSLCGGIVQNDFDDFPLVVVVVVVVQVLVAVFLVVSEIAAVGVVIEMAFAIVALFG
jgi:uncharacterized protein (DUF983 family)